MLGSSCVKNDCFLIILLSLRGKFSGKNNNFQLLSEFDSPLQNRKSSELLLKKNKFTAFKLGSSGYKDYVSIGVLFSMIAFISERLFSATSAICSIV